MKTNTPKSILNNLVIQEADEDLLIYNTVNHKTFCLNKPLALIWELVDGNNNLIEIKQKLSAKLKYQISDEYVLLALDQLRRENLIDLNFEESNKDFVINRRELIRKIGFNTIVALPMISILIAPTALQSASGTCLVSGQPCTISSECCSTNTTNLENPPGTVVGTFTGSCCRNGTGLYGANHTCVPGNDGDVIPAGFVTWNGTTRAFSGTLSCF